MKMLHSIVLSVLLVTSAAFADFTTEGANDWKKYSTPGEQHKILKELSGNWKHTLKWWMKPGTNPEMHTGTNTNKMILGGRFLQQDAKGKAMGQPFQGVGLTGFDLLREEFQSVWLDNMSTSMMSSTGTYDAATKTIKETGTFSDAMTGEKNRWYRAEWKILDKNNYTYEMYVKGTDGAEFKSMEITYKRG